MKSDAKDLFRRAAEFGPGLNGQRRAPTDDDLRELRAAFTEQELPIPVFLEGVPDWVDRRAKLFESGEYPDKGVSVTDAQLAVIASRFTEPVPVLIEHAESPLELGYLTHVEAVGNELFGTISLTAEANALAERSGARSLSIGLTGDLGQIREVSLVRAPRVVDARLFSESPCFCLPQCGLEPNFVNWRQRAEELERKMHDDWAKRQVQAFVASGRLTPAQAPIAEAIMRVSDRIEFDGDSAHVAKLFVDLLELRPGLRLFGELAPNANAEAAAVALLPEEAEFYRRHFPDVALSEIAGVRR